MSELVSRRRFVAGTLAAGAAAAPAEASAATPPRHKPTRSQHAGVAVVGAAYWNGYMDGAVRSGERAAAEVLAELRTRSREIPPDADSSRSDV